MRFTEPLLRLRARLAASCAVLLSACSPSAPPPPPVSAPPAPSVEPAGRGGRSSPAEPSRPVGPAAPSDHAGPAPSPARPLPAPRKLPPPTPARDWTQFKLQAAHRLVEANPGITYLSQPPEVLLAIPVLEIELNRDGSVRRIEVLRQPRQALDTVAIATAAVHRAAPFGDVSHLPRPWRFTETFLFDDERRFKPRSLD